MEFEDYNAPTIFVIFKDHFEKFRFPIFFAKLSWI